MKRLVSVTINPKSFNEALEKLSLEYIPSIDELVVFSSLEVDDKIEAVAITGIEINKYLNKIGLNLKVEKL